MQDNINPSKGPVPETPKEKRASNLLFVFILASWLLFLLFFGGKGPS